MTESTETVSTNSVISKDVMNAAEQLKRGLPLLKNDYYAKKVTGSVVELRGQSRFP